MRVELILFGKFIMKFYADKSHVFKIGVIKTKAFSCLQLQLKQLW